MANTVIQVKRTSVAGRAANSTTLPNAGQLALNMADRILYSTDGTTVFEIGANVSSQRAGNSTVFTIANSSGVTVGNSTVYSYLDSSSLGTTHPSGASFFANASSFYMDRAEIDGTSTSFYTATETAIYYGSNGNVGIGATNPTARLHVNGYMQATSGAVPISNTSGSNLGLTTARWNIQANAANFSNNVVVGNVTHFLTANTIGLFPATNTATMQIGTDTGRFNIIANTGNFSQALTANGGVFPSSNTVGSSLGASTLRFNLSANTIDSSGGVNPVSNTVGTALGTTTARWVLTANSADFSGKVVTKASDTTEAGFKITPGVAPNTPADGDIWVTTGTSFAVRLSSTTYFAAWLNGTQTFTGAKTFSAAITSGADVVPTSNTAGMNLGSTIARFILFANTGDFSGAVTSSGGVNPSSNTVGTALGTTTARWNMVANTATLSGNLTLSTASAVSANGSVGTQGQVLTTDGTKVFWRGVVNSATSSGSSISVGSTAPASPATGDIWVDTNGVGITAETVTASPSSNQNDYAPGLSGDNTQVSVLSLTPTTSIKLTGLSTSGWTQGKRVIIRNNEDPYSASGRVIIIERQSSSSLAANRFSWALKVPIFLIPGEELSLYFDGTNLKVVGGTRRYGTAQGFEHYLPHNMPSLNNWTIGTGATAGVWGGSGTAYAAHGVSRLQTGTTATGIISTAPDNLSQYGRSWWAGKNGCALAMARCAPQLGLSTVAEEYRAFFGFTSCDAPNFTGADAANPVNMIGYRYDRLALGTNWRQCTRNNSVSTDTDTGVAVALHSSATYFWGCVFVNGDGTRVDFFWSTDDGATWTISATSHTTNIPAASNRGVGTSFVLAKTAGTTNRDMLISDLASLGGTSL